MTPLDLTTAPPRSPRAELDGVVFLPRSIDKVRATLPGGRIGDYQIPGFTQIMLETLGISLEEFTAAVAAASTDAEVAAYVRAHTTAAKIEEYNTYAKQRKPRGGDRVAAREIFPWIDTRPDLILALDLIEEDDRRHFAGRS